MRWKDFGISGIVLSILFVISWVVFLTPSVHKPLREWFAPPERKILSVAIGRVIPEKSPVRVVKLSTREGLFVEVYGDLEGEHQPLIDRIALPDRKDAFIQFMGRASNLALKDMDGDNVFEIIAPTYTASLAPRINIFRYNKDSNSFEAYIE